MGDFEDVFGAGADSDAIIAYYSRNNTDYDDPQTAAQKKAEESPEAYEYANWLAKMRRMGFSEGPTFSSFSELDAWRKDNVGVENISRRIGDLFFVAVKDES